MLGSLMNALMQPGPGGQPSAGSSMLSEVVGGLMGGQQGGGAPVNQLLGSLQQVMNAQPGSAPANNPLMGLLGPVANAVANQVGISPAVATTVAATAMHYLVSNHPAAGGTANVAQTLASGSVPPAAVSAVVQNTGLSQADAQKALAATMNHFQEHAKQHAANLQAGKKRRDG